MKVHDFIWLVTKVHDIKRTFGDRYPGDRECTQVLKVQRQITTNILLQNYFKSLCFVHFQNF